MSSAQPPEGWDQPNEQMMLMARTFRQMYVAFVASGFTASEAAMIIGAWVAAAGNNATSLPPPGSE